MLETPCPGAVSRDAARRLSRAMVIPIPPCPGSSATPRSRALAGSHHAKQFWFLITLPPSGAPEVCFFFFLRGLGLQRAAAAFGVCSESAPAAPLAAGSAPRRAAAAEPVAKAAPEIKLAGWSQPGSVWGVLDFWDQGRVWGDPHPKRGAGEVFHDAVGMG